jgi:lipid A oxidase
VRAAFAIGGCALFASLGFVQPCRADWTVAAYLGASVTAAADLTLDQPAVSRRVKWTAVPFDSRSFEAPPYYGYRVGWRPSGRLGVEAELIHLKVYARTGALGPAVERFSISHGLNLLLANVVWRQPLGRQVRLVTRGGVGVAMPHGESRVDGVDRGQYEISGAALQGAVGPELVLSGHARVFLEYKVTTAAPTVAVAGGTIQGRYTSQHVAMGLGVEW